MDKFRQAVVDWANSIQLIEIVAVIIIGAILYKFSDVIITWVVNSIGRRAHSREDKNERKKRLKTLDDLFTTVAKIIVVLTVAFTILSDLGVNLGVIFASSAVAGVALGFGAQNMIKDALAGFFIILENQYRVGDFIDISGNGIPADKGSGTVERLSIRSTSLRDRDGNVHFIPNGAIVQVVNKTLGFSKVHFTFAVATGTDTEKLISLINDMGQDMAKEKQWKSKIVDPPRFSEIGKIGRDGFNVTVTGITEPADQWEVSSEFRRQLVDRMRHEKIEIIETIN